MQLMRSSISYAAVLLLLLLAFVITTNGETRGADFYDDACDYCAQTNRCNSRISSAVYTYCGQGMVYLSNPNNTHSVFMCCHDINSTSDPWKCQSYSGPSDVSGYQIVGGYQCYSPDSSYTALKLTLLVIVLVVVFVCVSPCVLICICCYCCGRCRRRRESLPTALINVTPSWMLQSPSAPAAHSYYQMT
jgi:hypothetical protein